MKQYVKYIYGCVAILLVTVLGTLAGMYYIPWTSGSREDVETVVISENQTGAEIGDVRGPWISYNMGITKFLITLV